jgi:PPOX class probable F420-dependent enzyme
MRKMTDQQWRDFVSHGTRTGKLSSVRADGSPHVVPVWFLLDGDDVVFQTGKDAIKGRNLTRDGRFALCVDDDQPPYNFVAIQGHAELSEEPGEVRDWAGRLGARYMGPGNAEQYAARNGGPGILLVRGRINKVSVFSGITD